MKYTRFEDIPQLIQDGSYQIDADILYLLDWIEDNDVHLTPDFQRARVWTREQQIKFMEYIFRGGRSGRVLYFNKPSWQNDRYVGKYDEMVCVDGLQRITAIQRFVNNEIPMFESYYREYTNGKRRMDRVMMKINVNSLKSEAEVLEWYLQMNTGGTPHTQEEIARVRALLESKSTKKGKPQPTNDVKEEKLRYSDFIVIKTRPSQFVPGMTVYDDDDCSCPRCRTILSGGVKHEVSRQCPTCGLNMSLRGNELYVSGADTRLTTPSGVAHG